MPRYAAQIGSTLTGLRHPHVADLGNVGLGSRRLTGTLSRCTWHLFSIRVRREDWEIVDKVRGQLANLWDIDPTQIFDIEEMGRWRDH